MLPCFLADADAELTRVVVKTVMAHGLWLVVHPDLRATARVRVLFDFLAELVRSERTTLRGETVKEGAARLPTSS